MKQQYSFNQWLSFIQQLCLQLLQKLQLLYYKFFYAHIPKGAIITGQICFAKSCIIDGEIIGTIISHKKVVIGKDAIVEGDIEGKNIRIYGKVTGNIIAKKSVSLFDNALVNGYITALQVQINDAASYTQNIIDSLPEIEKDNLLTEKMDEVVENKGISIAENTWF